MLKNDEGLTKQEELVRQIALLRIYVYRYQGKRPRRSLVLMSLNNHPTDKKGSLADELYQILKAMENLDRRMLLGGNNNTARMLSVWWIDQRRIRKSAEFKEQEKQNNETVISKALQRVAIAGRKALGY